MSNTQEKKIKLPIVSSMTCYEAVENHKSMCKRKNCKQWIDFEQGRNCLMITTQAGPLTLNEIGKIYGLTRMRICQIEKNIYQKIRSFIQA
jgi:DNA-directed RNA polymerase specialized sigma subunit